MKIKCTSCSYEFEARAAGFHICPNCHTGVTDTVQDEATLHRRINRILKSRKFYVVTVASLLLILVGFGIAQNVRAYQLVGAAATLNSSGRYDEASHALHKAPSFLVLEYLRQKVDAETAKNKRWQVYSGYQTEAARLMAAGKHTEALVLLRKISSDFPTYSSVSKDIARGTKGQEDTPVAAVIVAPVPTKTSPPLANMPSNPIISNALCKVDASLAVDLTELAQNMANICLTTFPKIEQMLSASPYPAPHNIQLTHSTYAIGAAQGNEVTVQIEYIRSHPSDMGMLVHELTHVVQGYPGGPGWLTEGIADYTRNKLGYTSASNYVCNSSSNYLSGYNCAASLLSYVERTHSANIIKELHTAMRNGTYTDNLFVQKTGKTLSQLYAHCLSYDCKGGKP